MSKEQYIEAHEELIAEFLELNPGLPWSVAHEATAEHVADRIADKYAAMVDSWPQQEEANG